MHHYRHSSAQRPAPPRTAIARCIAAALVATGLLLGMGVTSANADDIDDRRNAAEKRQQEVMANQATLQDELEGTDAELSQAVLDLQVIEARLPVAQAELDAAHAEVGRTQRAADLLAQRLAEAQAQEAAITAEIETSVTQTDAAHAGIAELARQAYRGDGQVSSLGLITGAQSTEQFIDEYAVSSTASRSQARGLADLQQAESVSRNREARLAAVRDSIANLKAQADINLSAAQTAQQAAADRKAEVETLVAQQQAKNAVIEARKADAVAGLAKADSDQQALTAELKGIIAEQQARDAEAAAAAAAAEAARKASAGKGGAANAAPAPGANSGTQRTGKVLNYPTAVPVVTSSFGMRLHPVLGIWRLHSGTDFRAYCGTEVMAAADGTVKVARTWDTGLNQVVIDHGTVNGANLMTGYLHLTSWTVSVGQHVSQGQVIGYSGNTGVSTACHLHFEVYVNGDYVDPMTMLR